MQTPLYENWKDKKLEITGNKNPYPLDPTVPKKGRYFYPTQYQQKIVYEKIEKFDFRIGPDKQLLFLIIYKNFKSNGAMDLQL